MTICQFHPPPITCSFTSKKNCIHIQEKSHTLVCPTLKLPMMPGLVGGMIIMTIVRIGVDDADADANADSDDDDVGNDCDYDTFSVEKLQS